MYKHALYLWLLILPALMAGDYYCATNGDGSDGSSWSKAYTNIQSALEVAVSNDTIYLAGQTFRPPFNSTAGRLLWQKSYVSILGGYAMDGTPGTKSNIPTTLQGLLPSTTLESNRLMMIRYVTNGILRDCNFVGGNVSRFGAGIYSTSNVNLTVDHCSFISNTLNMNSSKYGVGMYTTFSSVIVSNCMFLTNTAQNGSGTYGMGIALNEGTLTVVGSSFIGAPHGNIADSHGGALANMSGFMRLRNCLTRNNTASSAVYSWDGSWVQWPNTKCYTYIDNCTIVASPGYGIYRNNGFIVITNSILWNNSSGDVGWLVWNVPAGPIIGYSCSQSGISNGFNNVTNADPLFENPAQNNYRLSRVSPYRNAGTNLSWAAGGFDLDGNRRLLGPRVDIGAYEIQPLRGTVISIL